MLRLVGAPPSQPVLLVAGMMLAPTPLQGGVLAPFPWSVILSLVTGPDGTLALTVRGGDGPPASVIIQALLPIPGGAGFSNALEAIVGL